MKKAILTTAFLLFTTLFVTQAQAQDYYVCDTGSDSNSGTSQQEPWQTFDFAIGKFNQFKAGDSLLLCRGGVFTSSYTRITNFNCKGYNPCTISDYYTPSWLSSNPPIINGNTYGALNFQDGGNADHDEGYVVKNLSLKGIGSGYGIFLFNDVDYVTVDGVNIDAFSVGIFSARANTPNIGANQINENIALKNSIITNNSGQGWLGGCNNCAIDNNKFTNNGFAQKLLNHNLYASNSVNLKITNNELYQSALIDGLCQGVSMVVHGNVKDLVIRGNYVHEDVGAAAQTCWGIAVDPGYTIEESFTNIVIEENTVKNVGNLGIGCASCADTSILNNKIIHEQNFGFTAIAIPDRTEDTFKSDRAQISGNVIELTGANKLDVVVPDTGKFNVGSNSVIKY
jgi:hypothetical protein